MDLEPTKRIGMKHSHNICILEPDPFFAGLYARKFEARGWKTNVVERAADMEKCLDESDLLIVDIEGDDYKARDLVESLKKSKEHKMLPIVVLTKVSDREAVGKLMKMGVDAYLFKGHFVPNEVVDKVHRILDSRVV